MNIHSLTPPIIAFFGGRKTGKTTIISNLIKELSRRGLRIAAYKHVHHPLELNRRGKDTRKLMDSGAQLVIGVSNEGLVLFEKGSERKLLEKTFRYSSLSNVDLIILEGFKSLFAKNSEVLKILIATNVNELEELFKVVSEPVIAISGEVAYEVKEFKGKPVIDPRDTNRLINVILPFIK